MTLVGVLAFFFLIMTMHSINFFFALFEHVVLYIYIYEVPPQLIGFRRRPFHVSVIIIKKNLMVNN
jgi:hypothetical protein